MNIEKSIVNGTLLLLVLASQSVCSQGFDAKKMDALFDTMGSHNRMMGHLRLLK
jgi:hypothetical protein